MAPAAAPEVMVCGSADNLAKQAAREFSRAAQKSAAARGRFRVALAGGSTPRAAYALLANAPLRQQVPWQQTEVFWADERVVPPNDPASNYRMAHEMLLAHVPIPPDHIHRFRTELSPPDAIARQYEDELRASFQCARPRFDLILLGMGEDGHTASLFPHAAALGERNKLALALYAAHLHTYRVTLTLPVLNEARLVIFLVSGRAKAETLRHVLRGERQFERWPAQAVQPRQGRVVWLVDRDAAGLLHPGGDARG
ncbi:MAG TPA: 6-phosphogluconolactonase [Candidatus Binatia bacterium]